MYYISETRIDNILSAAGRKGGALYSFCSEWLADLEQVPDECCQCPEYPYRDEDIDIETEVQKCAEDRQG